LDLLNSLFETFINLLVSEKILSVILPIFLSSILINVWKYFFDKRRSQRIKSANDELTKMLIFYMVEEPHLTKAIIQSMKEGLALKHNIDVENIQSIEHGLKKVHSYILLSNEFSLAQKNIFYDYFEKRSFSLIDMDYQKRKNKLPFKKRILPSLQIILIIWCLYLMIITIFGLINNTLPTQLYELMSIAFASFICSVIAFALTELILKSLAKIKLWF